MQPDFSRVIYVPCALLSISENEVIIAFLLGLKNKNETHKCRAQEQVLICGYFAWMDGHPASLCEVDVGLGVLRCSPKKKKKVNIVAERGKSNNKGVDGDQKGGRKGQGKKSVGR